jgi:hypothetical protein
MRGRNREGPLHTHAVRHLADGESSRLAFALALDHIAFEALDPLFVTFYNFIVNGHIVSGFEAGHGSFARQLLVYECYSGVHNLNFKDGKGRAFPPIAKEKSK